MKVIKRNLEKDFIYLDEIDITEHIVVCKLRGNVYILSREKYNGGNFKWFIINDQFINGNKIAQDFSLIEEAVENFIDNSNAEMQVFEDWKKALKWAVKN